MKVITADFIKSAARPSQYPAGYLPEIAFAGRSNVGKSSLINTLTQRKGLAKTSNSPGCTQLINFFTVNNQLSFADLPGYGFAKVPDTVRERWVPMVEMYLKERQALKLVILVLDIRRDPTENDLSLLRWFEFYRVPCLIALTKIDKVSRQQISRRKQMIINSIVHPDIPAVPFSSRTGAGKEELWKEIKKYILQGIK